VRGFRERAALEPLRGPGLVGSAALHALVVVTFLASGGLKGREKLPPVYRVSLIAAPGTPAPAEAPAAAAAPATPAPKPAPTSQTLHPAPAVSRTPAVPLKTAAAPPQRVPAPTTPTPAQSTPTPPGSPSGTAGGTDVATIRTEGVEFPFPGYLSNLVSAVYRRWRPAPSNALLEAEVFFIVHRDGSMTGLQFIRRSGSFSFDLEAQGAVEAAARAGAFGSLPAGYGPDVLPVSFFFNPRSVR
jgi:protein TonB